MKLAPVAAFLLLSVSASAQVPAPISPEDATAMQALVTGYAQALTACNAEDYAVRGIADLGRAGQYQDDYVKTPRGWRILSRTVLTPAERAAGLDASEMAAIWRAAGSEFVDYYVPDQNGVKRLRTSGVAIGVSDGVVTGRAYLKDGGYYDDVYEKTGPGQWRIKSRTLVAAR